MLIALIALIVSIIGITIYRNRKSLAYRVSLSTRLMSTEADREGRVQVTFDGEPVHDVRLVAIRVRNTGNVPIQRTDYEEQLGFSFGKDARVLTAEVTETRPDTLTAHVYTTEDRVLLSPTLLNSGDTISIKVLLTGEEEVTFEGRIVGVSKVRQVKERTWVVLVVGVAALAAVLTVGILSPPDWVQGAVIFASFAALMAAISTGGSLSTL